MSQTNQIAYSEPREINFSGLKRAIVIQNVDPKGLGRVAVVISEVMPKVGLNDTPKEANTKTTNSAKNVRNKDDNVFSNNIQEINYFWVRPTFLSSSSKTEKTVSSQVKSVSPEEQTGTHQTVTIGKVLATDNYTQYASEYRVPRIGTAIWIMFEDEDPQKAYAMPFGPTLDHEVTPMKNVDFKDNVNAPERKVNIDVLREWINSSTVYYDSNENCNTFAIVLNDGSRIKIESTAERKNISLETAGGMSLRLVDRSSKTTMGNDRNANNIDGKEGGSYVELRSAKGSYLQLDDNGGKEKVILKSSSGHELIMNDVAKRVDIRTAGGCAIEMIEGATINIISDAAVNISTKDGTVTCNGNMNVNSTGTVTVNAEGGIHLNPGA